MRMHMVCVWTLLEARRSRARTRTGGMSILSPGYAVAVAQLAATGGADTMALIPPGARRCNSCPFVLCFVLPRFATSIWPLELLYTALSLHAAPVERAPRGTSTTKYNALEAAIVTDQLTDIRVPQSHRSVTPEFSHCPLPSPSSLAPSQSAT
jgi:hypothetical protein